MIVVIITIGIILFIIGGGFYLGDIENWTPFFPFGVIGAFHGSASIFFAYVGFDAVATAAEEAKNPQRVIIKILFQIITIEHLLTLDFLSGFTNWYSGLIGTLYSSICFSIRIFNLYDFL
jgi:amino acid transporter